MPLAAALGGPVATPDKQPERGFQVGVDVGSGGSVAKQTLAIVAIIVDVFGELVVEACGM